MKKAVDGRGLSVALRVAETGNMQRRPQRGGLRGQDARWRPESRHTVMDWPLTRGQLDTGRIGGEPEKKPATIGLKEKTYRLLSGPLASTLVEYTQNSSMHGLRYVGDRLLHPLERIFWVLAFLVAVGSSGYFISNLFTRFDLMPVIMSLSPQAVTMGEIPFPSITICNMNHLRRSEALRIINQSTSPETELDEKLIYDFCDSSSVPSDVDVNLTADWEYMKKFMVRVTQPCHELLVSCLWHGDTINCNDLFNPSLTDEGMCCVFNRLNRELIFQKPRDLSDLNVTYPFPSVDWSPERGYPPPPPQPSPVGGGGGVGGTGSSSSSASRLDNLPRRARGAGTHLGLTLLVDAELHEYYCSSENSKGFKILLSNPIETPKVSAFGLSIGPGQETKVVVLPRIMTASPQLESIDLRKRLCYFEEERQLAFYRTYTQRSCALECEANYTLALCSCVLYYMPSRMEMGMIVEDMETAGGWGGNRSRAADQVGSGSGGKAGESAGDQLTNGGGGCSCLPGCFELTYGYVLSGAPLTDKLLIRPTFQPNRDYAYFKENMAIIHFYYMESQFASTVRGVLYGFTEFLSNAGGLLGLFMGFSFMSAIEMVYFLTLRLLFQLADYWRRKRSQQQPTAEAAVNSNTTTALLNNSKTAVYNSLFKKTTIPFRH